MRLKEKLNPWNWFKHEESNTNSQIPIHKQETSHAPSHYQSVNSPLLDLHRQMNGVFDNAFKSFGLPSLLSESKFSNFVNEGAFHPNLDISSDGKEYLVALDLPGMKESEVNIEVRGDQLIIEGQKQTETENKDRDFYRVERSYGAFQRVLSLPDDANGSDMNATMKGGVLKLNIPRQETADIDTKKISIN